MKIAIMTWFHYENYGTFLQATALSEKLKSYGHEVKIIQYYPREKEELLPDKKIYEELIEKLFRKIRSRGIRNIIAEKNGERFKTYSRKFFSLTEICETLSDLEGLNNEFDAFVCGSDQIWSPLVFDSHYFLDFVKNPNKKIAYAPSMGVAEIKEKAIVKEIEKLLGNFESISVREESGSKMVSEMKSREIPVTLDPTLLLTKEDWAELFGLKETKEKYLLAYFLGNNKKYWKKTEEIAKKLNLEVRIIPVFSKDLSRNGIVSDVGPEEFAELFYNASYVCTDSFHGVAFSVNFGKEFTCFERFKKGDKENQNTRIYNILEKLDLKDRLDCFDVGKKINKTVVENKLGLWREKSEMFLIDSLDKASGESKDESGKKHIFENNSLCSGCGACKTICPKKSIEVLKNQNGFYMASVDEDSCVSCGKCKSVCPMQSDNNPKSVSEGKLFSYKDNDIDILASSSSGAFAYRLSEILSQKGYSVAGCVFDVEKQKAKHIIAPPGDIETLKNFRGSKYMQSDFSCITSELLLCKTPIAIFGTPCQIAGARNILKGRKDVVFVDLICHGVPSYNLFEKYKTTLKEKYGFACDEFDVNFRYKPKGWRERYMSVSADGKTLLQHKSENEYFLMFESKNCYSEACYECRWRSSCSADLRIGDYWGERFLDDKTGVSMVLAMNETGEDILRETESYGRIVEEDVSDYFASQQTENVSRTVYYSDVAEMLTDKRISLEEIVEKYITPFEKRKQVKSKIHEKINKIKKIIR